jgi:hypothetical protein
VPLFLVAVTALFTVDIICKRQLPWIDLHKPFSNFGLCGTDACNKFRNKDIKGIAKMKPFNAKTYYAQQAMQSDKIYL